MDNYTDINAKTIDCWVDKGWEWSVPLSHEAYKNAKNGKWDVVLTPIKPVPHEWFAPYIQNKRLDGVKLLGLASGGGQQIQSATFRSKPRKPEIGILRRLWTGLTII